MPLRTRKQPLGCRFQALRSLVTDEKTDLRAMRVRCFFGVQSLMPETRTLPRKAAMIARVTHLGGRGIAAVDLSARCVEPFPRLPQAFLTALPHHDFEDVLRLAPRRNTSPAVRFCASIFGVLRSTSPNCECRCGSTPAPLANLAHNAHQERLKPLIKRF